MQAMTPITPLEPGVEMFQRGKTQSFLFPPRTEIPRPLSDATEIFDDIDDDSSEFEEDSPKYSFESNDSRKSQTTLSSFDEVITPHSGQQDGFYFRAQDLRPTQGPKGPHLFRASQSSDIEYEYALQMSPLLPKQMVLDPREAYANQTPATVIAPYQFTSMATALEESDPDDANNWSSQEVASWMFQLGFDEAVVDKFEAHDITGAVLLDMQFDDLRELDIPSFGKRHQLWNHIEALRDNDGRISPAPTPFQDTSRPATRVNRTNSTRERSKSRHRKRDKSRNKDHHDDFDDGMTPITPGGGKKRKNKKNRGPDDPVLPGESVSIVAIEQLLPKPHKCAKGQRCAKWRKQQRLIARLQSEHGIGGFPISPEKGGHIFVAGDPGNAQTAGKVVDNVFRPASENVASVVASSAALPSATLPEFSLEEQALQHIESRDPQENVKQFLNLQGIDPSDMYYSPVDRPATPPLELFPPLHPPELKQSPHNNLKSLPKLTIPRSSSAQPTGHLMPGSANLNPLSAFSPCQTAITPSMSPSGVYRFGTPCSEMDVPVTAIPIGPVSRDTSQSVPPNMQFRDQHTLSRSLSRADWRRPSFALPALNEGEVFSPIEQNEDAQSSHSSDATLHGHAPSGSQEHANPKTPHSAHSDKVIAKPLEVAGHELRPPSGSSMSQTHYTGVTHAGWMKKRRTKLLRHEWQDAHFRLAGTMLSQHANALPSTNPLSTIDVDDYAVACSSIASSKLSAKLKALKIVNNSNTANPTDAAFSFQLVPSIEAADGERRKKAAAGSKTHHFAVKTRDERIDWMRELMLAKALQAKGKGYEVEVNGSAV